MKKIAIEIYAAIAALNIIKQKIKKGTFNESDRALMEKIGSGLCYQAVAHKFTNEK
jgi:hypothetical protein